MRISLRNGLLVDSAAVRPFLAVAAVLALILTTAARCALAQAPTDWHLPERLPARELRPDGISVIVNPLLVEPVMGFLIGRGFPLAQAQRYAAGCVIRVTMRNESAPAAISYDLRSWRMRRPDGALNALRPREDWMRDWQNAGLSDASKIGFEWSQLPSALKLDRGDSTQGMIHTGLPAGSRFDLLLEWVSDGKIIRDKLKGIDCAPGS